MSAVPDNKFQLIFEIPLAIPGYPMAGRVVALAAPTIPELQNIAQLQTQGCLGYRSVKLKFIGGGQHPSDVSVNLPNGKTITLTP